MNSHYQFNRNRQQLDSHSHAYGNALNGWQFIHMWLYLLLAALVSQGRLFHLSEMSPLASLKLQPMGAPKMRIEESLNIFFFALLTFFSLSTEALQETDVMTNCEGVSFWQENFFPSCTEKETHQWLERPVSHVSLKGYQFIMVVFTQLIKDADAMYFWTCFLVFFIFYFIFFLRYNTWITGCLPLFIR